MDQCLKCNHFNRPDMCAGEDCSIKESWYCQYLIKQNADALAAIEALGVRLDEWKRQWRLMEAAEKKAETIKDKEIAKYQQWVNDLQSGMYINCVYCGHRYGPRKNTPVAMADVLKQHIEKCSKHPLSMAMREKEIAEEQIATLQEETARLYAITVEQDNALSGRDKIIEKLKGYLANKKTDIAEKVEYIAALTAENTLLREALEEYHPHEMDMLGNVIGGKEAGDDPKQE